MWQLPRGHRKLKHKAVKMNIILMIRIIIILRSTNTCVLPESWKDSVTWKWKWYQLQFVPTGLKKENRETRYITFGFYFMAYQILLVI